MLAAALLQDGTHRQPSLAASDDDGVVSLSHKDCYPISYPTEHAETKRANNRGRFAHRAAYSKTVSGGFPLTRVRIPPPPFCDVSGHRRQMSRHIVDTL